MRFLRSGSESRMSHSRAAADARLTRTGAPHGMNRALAAALGRPFDFHDGRSPCPTSAHDRIRPFTTPMRGRRSLSSAARAPGSSRTDGTPLPRLSRRHRRQRPRPRPSASRRGAEGAGRQALARLQHLRDPGPGAARRHGSWRRPSPTRCSSPIPAPRRSNARSRRRGATISSNGRAGALPHHHLRGRLPRPDAGDPRRRRASRNISKASARRSRGSTRCRSAT